MAYKCFADKCAQKAELRSTGYHLPHPTHFCPVCKTAYWLHDIEHKDAKNKVVYRECVMRNYPFNKSTWGAKPAEYYLDQYDYWWRPTENKAKHEAEELAKKKAEEED